jgi:hypothetical protein
MNLKIKIANIMDVLEIQEDVEDEIDEDVEDEADED